jgi:hypothetical protein
LETILDASNVAEEANQKKPAKSSPLIAEGKAAPVKKANRNTVTETTLTAESKTAPMYALSNENDSISLVESFKEIKKEETSPTRNLIPSEVTVEPDKENVPQEAANPPKANPPTAPASGTKVIIISPERRTRKKKRDIFKGMKKKKDKRPSVSAHDHGQNGTLGSINGNRDANAVSRTVKKKKKKKRSRRKKRLRVLSMVLAFALVVGLVLSHCGFFQQQALGESPSQGSCFPEKSLLKRIFTRRDKTGKLMYYVDKYKHGSRRKSFVSFW